MHIEIIFDVYQSYYSLAFKSNRQKCFKHLFDCIMLNIH